MADKAQTPQPDDAEVQRLRTEKDQAAQLGDAGRVAEIEQELRNAGHTEQ